MDYLISMYIDNELSIEEKIVFVEHVHESKRFADAAVSFLKQEKILRSALPEKMPEETLPLSSQAKFSLFAPRALGLAFAVSLLILVALYFDIISRHKRIYTHHLPYISTGLSYTSPVSSRLK